MLLPDRMDEIRGDLVTMNVQPVVYRTIDGLMHEVVPVYLHPHMEFSAHRRLENPLHARGVRIQLVGPGPMKRACGVIVQGADR